MHCAGCRRELQAISPFCPHCGRQNRWACDACGVLNELEHRFCPTCGTKRPPQSGPSADANDLPLAERRQLTIMFV
ncbi:MAG: zinc ribbon domain-containing protein, partial [Acetobacteraceae bacterium]|nr:zinc ribbon domain-containing protein [Acetobacteraceae bacterium]